MVDAFAGSGALGIEALSRGAVHCTFIERDRDALEVLRTLVFKETDVSATEARWFRVRIMPYRTLSNMIQGAVLTFVDISAASAKERSLPLDALQKLNPGRIHHIQIAAAEAARAPQTGETGSPNAMRWLPLTSRQAMDWVVLLDPSTARIRGFVQADGFGSQ